MICNICPHNCNIDRAVNYGYCQSGDKATICRIAPHFWEEPPLSSDNGSGTVFFGGCNMRCRFCQNSVISHGLTKGIAVTDRQLADIFLYVNDNMNVNNINLVTPQHFLLQICNALQLVKHRLTKPVVYNTNAYEKVESLSKLNGLIDVYLPDLKYYDSDLSFKYSGVKNYFEVATKAIIEMKRQQPYDIFDEKLIRQGVIIRHLVMPTHAEDSKHILDWISGNFPDSYVSLMAQYFPTHIDKAYPELNRRVTRREYNQVLEYFFNVGLTKGFSQDAESATEDYVPDFDTDGVRDILDKIATNKRGNL